MTSRPLRLIAVLVVATPLANPAAAVADLAPYRARYALALASTDASGGVIGGGGVLLDEWHRTCDGWTEQEHFYLHLQYGEDNVSRGTSDSYSTLATWEANDASRFGFDLRRVATNQPYEEIRGEARRAGAGGTATFTKPQALTLPLPRGTLFPAAHNRLLVERAQAGDRLIVRSVFDGSDVASAAPVSAVIGPKLAPGEARRQVAAQPPAESAILADQARLLLCRPRRRAARVRGKRATARQRRRAGHAARLRRLQHSRPAGADRGAAAAALLEFHACDRQPLVRARAIGGLIPRAILRRRSRSSSSTARWRCRPASSRRKWRMPRSPPS